MPDEPTTYYPITVFETQSEEMLWKKLSTLYHSLISGTAIEAKITVYNPIDTQPTYRLKVTRIRSTS